MGLFKKFFEQRKKIIEERNRNCNEAICQIENALLNVNALFADTHRFIDPVISRKTKEEYERMLMDMKHAGLNKFKRASGYRELFHKYNELYAITCGILKRAEHHNASVAKSMIPGAYDLIGDVEGRRLDQQQMACVVKDVKNHLVIAGAGTGKTTTIIGRIKYLLRAGKCKPEDILVLSFTNASASEMSTRIAKETGCPIAASTFHKLGLNIIAKVDGVMPRITQINMRKFIKEQIKSNMKDDSYLRLLLDYCLYDRVVAKSEFEFKTQAEYEEYLRLNPPTTIDNECVKSYGEMDIANFLVQNGVRYIYEHPYEVDTRTVEHAQYHPDFYLPDYKIYIEYFGINRNGEVPGYFSGTNEKSATESYQESMEWKRSIHREHGTQMIECYAYEKMDGCLLDSLKEKLAAVPVRMEPKSHRELWEQITQENDSLMGGLIELFETVINLIKSNGYSMAEVRRENISKGNLRANNMLISLVEPIFVAYCRQLEVNGEIDFNDMINVAADYVTKGRYNNSFKYVIVDEYQDISKARFKLLKALRKSMDYDLFCVGDDWQSIYRFAGSDIGYILNFSKYWGATEISRIETTYRFSQKLIEVSGKFIMQNPAQIKKSITGNDDVALPLGEINGYGDHAALQFMSYKIEELPKNSSVFFIGRYSFDAKMLSNTGLFACRYNNVTGFVDVRFAKRPDLRMAFVTAHKSKGLQADYVFIINNKSTRLGFPSKIQDAPILELLLDDCDQFPHAEERRLFYVALTRAKKKVYIVTVRNQESDFAMELKVRHREELRKERYECPSCGGQLVKRIGPYGEFLGCSNYRTSGCSYKRKLANGRH